MTNVDTRLTLMRQFTSDQGTLGHLLDETNQRLFYTLELPWRDNRRKISCIPLGEYLCTWVRSPRFGWVYTVNDIPDRSHVLIHSGNLAGDTSKGFTSHVEGCILLGNYKGSVNGQLAVLSSRPAVSRFNSLMDKESFILKIDAYSGDK